MPARLYCTPRQFAVLRELAKGKQLKQVAAALGITRRTACYHLYRAIKRLNCSTSAQAVAKLVNMEATCRITELEMEVERLRSIVHRRHKAA